MLTLEDPPFPLKTWWLSYVYLHHYPRYRQAPRVLGVSRDFINSEILPCLEWMGSTYDEIWWESRLSPWNHCQGFPYHVTGNSILSLIWKQVLLIHSQLLSINQETPLVLESFTIPSTKLMY
jgi:hypothetical protein